jgi:serine/threonine-protein kinase
VFERLRAALADRYKIERELGAGGMATVYLAEDLKHERKVALKVLKPDLAAVLGADRFIQEIKTTASLQHPNILPLFDSGEADSFLYYVMPYVEGESLRDRLNRERQLPIEDTIELTKTLAAALDYAHKRGVIHRDIKPENILLQEGVVLMADFGIALAVKAAGGERLTETGLSLGTPSYMSPEQVAGQRGLDARSDVYSLACVTYEMLAGDPPFVASSAQAVMAKHVTDPAPPITTTRPSVSPAIAHALTKALHKTAADRYESAGKFATALTTEAVEQRRAIRLALIAGGLLIVITSAWFGGRALSRPGPTANIERIAVLPMDNQTGDSTRVFFVNGMTRELIGVLTDADVRVLGYRAVTAYANTTLSAAQIARELEVDAIVTGAVIQAGEVIQVAAELTDPGTNENLWARTFSRPAPDVVTLQHEIALEIARGIRTRLSPDQERALAPARPVDPTAYAQYLLGQQQATLRTPDGFVQSVEHLTRSLALDSTFAPAWAALAMTNAYGLLYQLTPRDSGRALIERAAARATALDERLADPWFARGVALLHADWDFTAAEDAFRRGLERSGSTEARGLRGWTLWETGRFAERADDGPVAQRHLMELLVKRGHRGRPRLVAPGDRRGFHLL